jgi:hypothetical protein
MVALGLVTWANGVILQPETVDDTFKFSTRVAIGTGIAAAGLSLVGRASPPLARGVAFIALVTALFTRYQGRKSPIDNLAAWWKEG